MFFKRLIEKNENIVPTIDEEELATEYVNLALRRIRRIRRIQITHVILLFILIVVVIGFNGNEGLFSFESESNTNIKKWIVTVLWVIVFGFWLGTSLILIRQDLDEYKSKKRLGRLNFFLEMIVLAVLIDMIWGNNVIAWMNDTNYINTVVSIFGDNSVEQYKNIINIIIPVLSFFTGVAFY